MLFAAAVVATLVQPKPSGRLFRAGPALPAGQVQPQLVGSMSGVVLLAPDGSLWIWGGGQLSLSAVAGAVRSTIPVPMVSAHCDWQRVSLANSTVLAIKTNGTLWGWGNSTCGELLTNSPSVFGLTQLGSETNWVDVHLGHGHALALKQDGSLWAWGRNDYGAVGDGSGTNVLVPTHILPGTTWKAVVGPSFNSFGVQSDGTLWGWGHSLMGAGKVHMPVPVPLDSSTNWVSLAAGDFAMVAIKSDGTMWVCGANAHQLAGGATTGPSASMIRIGRDSDWIEAHVGNGFMLARKRDGSWWGCGVNGHGQLALGTASWGHIPLPQRLPFSFDPWAFATSLNGTTALLARDGTLWTWGVRAGKPYVLPWWDRLTVWWKSLWSHGHPVRTSYSPDWVHDKQPHYVWELPASVKAALGTNAASVNLRGP